MRSLFFTVIVVAVGIGCFLIGFSVAPGGGGAPGAGGPADERWYTCSMHPQIRQRGPGQCPICFMDLIPVAEERAAEGPILTLSEAAQRLARVETEPAAFRELAHVIRTVGRVAYDEPRLSTVSAWVPGRIERLYVDYTGVRVIAGDHLVDIYSPELRTAEAEYLWAVQASSRTGEARALVEAARQKLLLWGITPEQIADLERTGQPRERMTILAPTGGTVIEKMVVAGQYVETGMPLYRIADLTTVWVLIDIYELDLAWIRYGQAVRFEAEAYPGEVFEGQIAFIDPMLHEETRTVAVRVNVPNDGERLKPGMFVRAQIDAQLDQEGNVLAPDLAGKWMCPMHPEVIASAAGSCPICGMDLVPSERLGFAPRNAAPERPLSIPYTAPLITGERAIVYVEEDDPEGGPGSRRYVGREVRLGPRAGDYYVVVSGLQDGERVVRRGNFRIDASLQVLARPSMMSRMGAEAEEGPGGAPETTPGPEAPPFEGVPAAFQAGVGRLVEAYLGLQASLAGDDLAGARAALPALRDVLDSVDMGLVAGGAHEAWMGYVAGIRAALDAAAGTGDIDALREAFGPISTGVSEVARRYGHAGSDLHRFHCPMALSNRGGDWLQRDAVVRNPYFGARMLGCGAETALYRAAAPPPVPEESTAVLAEFRNQIGGVVIAYLRIQTALAGDDPVAAQAGLRAIREALDRVDDRLLTGEPHAAFAENRGAIRAALGTADRASGIEDLRTAFGPLSAAIVGTVRRFGHAGPDLHLVHCPMALGGAGADWLQEGSEIRNPYYGASMLHCGTEREVLRPAGE